MKQIYVVLSQTGTVLSRILKSLTHDMYNHASISLDPSLETMYSFGRLNPYNPFIGGFVIEGKNHGTFKRFFKTKAIVLELSITDDKFHEIEKYLAFLVEHRYEYKYNYWGLFLALFKKNYAPGNRFYCSQFVRHCLEAFNIENIDEIPKIVKPMDFLSLNNKRIIYNGVLKDYRLGAGDAVTIN